MMIYLALGPAVGKGIVRLRLEEGLFWVGFEDNRTGKGG